MQAQRYLPTLMLAAVVALATPACAAQMYGSGGGYGRDIERRAYDNGFREGIEEGRNDARHGRNFDPDRHSEYRDADQGYHRGEGDLNFYRRSYRQGFQAGYRETFQREARGNDPYRDGRVYGNAPVYAPPSVIYQDPRVVNPRGGYISSPAAQNGYRDGIEAGRNDARDRNRFDPVRAKRYREGDNDYDNRYGQRDDYKRDYRAAFQRGYEEGYGR